MKMQPLPARANTFCATPSIGRLSAADGSCHAREGRILRRRRPLYGRLPEGVCRTRFTPTTDFACAPPATKYDLARPFTKESLLYREIFEKYYPGQAEMIAGLLDAEPLVGRLRCRRSVRARALKLRRQRKIIRKRKKEDLTILLYLAVFTPPCRRDAGIIGSVFKLCSERHGKGGLGSFLLCTAGCVLPAP